MNPATPPPTPNTQHPISTCRLISDFTHNTMEQRLLVFAAYQARRIANDAGAVQKNKLLTRESELHAQVLRLPRGMLYEVIFDADKVLTNDGGAYTQLEEAGARLQAKSLKFKKGRRSTPPIPLIIFPELFYGTGNYHFMLHELLLPDYLALADYYDQFGGYAFLLTNDYRRSLFGHFTRLRDQRESAYTSLEHLCSKVLNLSENYRKENGDWNYKEIKRTILLPAAVWLRDKTDIDIFPTGKPYSEKITPADIRIEEKKYPGTKKVEGLFTRVRTIANRTAPGVLSLSYALYQL